MRCFAARPSVYFEQDYDVRIEVLAIGETSETEYYWSESIASDPTTGRDVARMIMMLRFMKASSPLWRSSDGKTVRPRACSVGYNEFGRPATVVVRPA